MPWRELYWHCNFFFYKVSHLKHPSGNALTLSSRTPGVEIPVAEVDGVANLVKTSTLFAKHILREWQSKAMIGPESDKYLKDKIAVSHRVKMIQNQESRVDQWQSWECRAGWAFRQPGWQPSALFPHPTTPHVCLWTAEHSTQGTLYLYPHYLHLPPSSPPLVQCRLYYILIWPWASSQQGHKSTSHVSLGQWPPKDQSLSYELKVNPQIVFFLFTVLPNNSRLVKLQRNTNINPL